MAKSPAGLPSRTMSGFIVAAVPRESVTSCEQLLDGRAPYQVGAILGLQRLRQVVDDVGDALRVVEVVVGSATA